MLRSYATVKFLLVATPIIKNSSQELTIIVLYIVFYNSFSAELRNTKEGISLMISELN